ncbi:hypothetical protein BS17DRAFT_712955, partial [Gyrodon lividus]
KVGTEHITAIAIVYLMQAAPLVYPTVGGCKIGYLKANLDAHCAHQANRAV